MSITLSDVNQSRVQELEKQNQDLVAKLEEFRLGRKEARQLMMLLLYLLGGEVQVDQQEHISFIEKLLDGKVMTTVDGEDSNTLNIKLHYLE